MKLKSEKHFIVSRDYPVFLFKAIKSFTGLRVHQFGTKKKIFRKFENIGSLSKIGETGVIIVLITISLSLEPMHKLIIKLRRISLGLMCQKISKKKFKKFSKTRKTCKDYSKKIA